MEKERPKQYVIKESTVKNIKGEKKFCAVLFEDGKPFPLIEIEPSTKYKYLGYLNIFHDLEFIKSCLIYLYKNFDNEEINFLKKSIWQSFIITYGKCFVNAKGRKIKLEPNSVFKKANKDLLRIHDELMELRHQYIAHSGINAYETLEVFLALDITNEKIIKGFYHSFKKVFTAGKENIKKYSILIEHIWQYVNNKVKEIDDKYQKHIIDTNTVENIITKAYYFDDNELRKLL